LCSKEERPPGILIKDKKPKMRESHHKKKGGEEKHIWRAMVAKGKNTVWRGNELQWWTKWNIKLSPPKREGRTLEVRGEGNLAMRRRRRTKIGITTRDKNEIKKTRGEWRKFFSTGKRGGGEKDLPEKKRPKRQTNIMQKKKGKTEKNWSPNQETS